jgi:hypothetical protein
MRHLPSGGYRVSTPGGVKAYRTTKTNAQRQARLLRGIEHGWHPTGAPAREGLINTQAKLLVNEVVTQARQLHEMRFTTLGDKVKHPQFGHGTVIRRHGQNRDDAVSIRLNRPHQGKSTMKVDLGDEEAMKKWRITKASGRKDD